MAIIPSVTISVTSVAIMLPSTISQSQEATSLGIHAIKATATAPYEHILSSSQSRPSSKPCPSATMSSESSALPKIFQPFKLGELTLAHRVVLAPLTRYRNSELTHVPLPNVKEYYAQRGSTPGTLLIAEATFVSPRAGGCKSTPGIYSDEQISAWKEVTDGVHAQGSFMYVQLWAPGRAVSVKDLMEKEGSPDYVAPESEIQLSDHEETPRALTIPEIKQYVQDYADAARNAVERAGFDGVELHVANGHLLDQFLQDTSNTRMDEYGGSVENRSRFALEVIDAIVKVVGAQKVGVRVTPWSKFNDMRMHDPIPQFSYFVGEIKKRHPDFAYLHVVEPRVQGAATRDAGDIEAWEQNDFLRDIWAPKPVISAGAYTRDMAMQVAEEKGDIVAVGRYFISNPDLPSRWRHNIPLTPYNRDTFYLVGDASSRGYTDYPFAEKIKESADLRTAAPIATPLLERASFNIDDVLGAADAGLLRFLQHTPRLQELSVTCHGLNAHIGLSLPSCPLLVSLHLAFESPYFIAPFLKSIQQYRASLKILRLRSFSIRDDVGDPSSTAPVEFPALNILCASGGGLKLLPLISTPNLHTLVVEFPPPDFPTLILNFLSRQPLNLRILELSQSHDRTWDAMTTATLLACMAHIDGLEELRFKYASVMDDFLTALIWRAEVDYRSCILPKTGLRVSHNYLPNLQVIMYDRTAPPSDILAELCRSRRMSTVSRGWDLIALVEGRKLDTVAGRYWTHSMWS
ncbi:hypothetical protein BD626DRAFT_635696 [Schizophyllum amplum]|uniref:NADH:flavin oxidoreductase/NADH oxidase N-terminal domain-containing protein n=1 Tax=Schizophyllum amplum TaxID=97359 RepID=A0A550BVQ4_9AGAR|nr:hypothetical protein BD626DRAFT_635696 [Auriculariopsis ampla]